MSEDAILDDMDYEEAEAELYAEWRHQLDLIIAIQDVAMDEMSSGD